MTKNSETLLPCPFCGSDARTDAGMGHARCSKTACELGKPGYAPWFTIEEWNTRAPVDLDSPFTEVTGTYPEPMTKNSETYLKPCPTPWCPEGTDFLLIDDRFVSCTSCGVKADSVEAWNTRAPERGEGQETGIDRFNPSLTKQGGIVPVAAMKQSGNGRFVSYEDHMAALSRQSAVGGDWDGDAVLLDTLLYAQGHGISNHAYSPGTPPTDILDDYEQSIPKDSESYRQSLRAIRRALRCATRTPEGEMCCRICIENISTDPNMRICQSCYDEHSAEPGFIEAVSGKTPPPRPTATGGITERQIKSVLSGLGTAEYLGHDGEFHQLEGAVWVGDACRDLLALIERAGEEDHE